MVEFVRKLFPVHGVQENDQFVAFFFLLSLFKNVVFYLSLLVDQSNGMFLGGITNAMCFRVSGSEFNEAFINWRIAWHQDN